MLGCFSNLAIIDSTFLDSDEKVWRRLLINKEGDHQFQDFLQY